jgi:hypothetical protein
MPTQKCNKAHLNAALTLIFLSLTSTAQIPNSGFEEWITACNRTSPVGWYSTNDLCDTMAGYFPITRSTDHFPQSVGSYSIRIANNLSAQDFAALGVAMTTPLDTTDTMDSPLFPISGHPDTLYGYYKFLPQNNDTMNISINLYKSSEWVASGDLSSSKPISEWTLFKIPLLTQMNTPYIDADSARMRISTFNSDKNFNIYGNSVLYIDNLSLNTPITHVTRLKSQKPISFSTSILDSKLTLVLQKRTFVSVRIYDLKGRMLRILMNEAQNAGWHVITLDCQRFSAGSFIIAVTAGVNSLQKRHSIVR